MKNYIGMYIGSHKVKSYKKIERLTFIGDPILGIVLDNKESMEMPLNVVEQVATKEKGDLTKLRDATGDYVASQILTILLNNEVRTEDVGYVLGRVDETILQRLRDASDILFGKPRHKLTLMDIQEVLQKNGKTKNTHN